MHRFMLLLGMGTALLAAHACRPRPDTPLTAAAADDDVAAIRRLLAEGHAPDEDGDAWTALMWAARQGATAAMTVLIDAGADVNARDYRNHWTPLLHAVHKQQAAAVRLLLERGADPNAPEGSGHTTPLLMAASDSDPAIVRLLLEYGADARYADHRGETPLTIAVSGGALSDVDRPLLGGCRLATVRTLLAHDPTLHVSKDAAGRRAIWWARFHGCEEVLTLIGELPTVPGQTLVGVGGVIRDELSETRRGDRPHTPATGAQSPR